ncbi:MAG: OmpH family outer membrane protein [Atribacterota bacterium]|nr:OmpH family outer membrane protein [Atribacterota bacterium]
MFFNLNVFTKWQSKLCISLSVVLILLAISMVGASAQSIGFISLTRVTASHPNTEKINQLNQELRAELQTRQEKLNQEGKGLEEADLIKLEEKFNSEWEPVKQKMLAQLQALQVERNSDIIQAIRAVGEKGNYQAILNSEVPVFTGNDMTEYPIILYGGENVTQDVITEIQNMAAAQ